LLDELIATVKEAAKAILEVYNSDDFEVSYKSDQSPLTIADKRSHEIIETTLKKLTPDIPVLSEEGKTIDYSERKKWKRFYLIDPLDGTKEFISRNGEFTINIALIQDSEPVIGVIHVPVQAVTYYAMKGHGAYKQDKDGKTQKITVKTSVDKDGLVVVASRSHPSQEVEDFLKKIKVKDRVSRGSSLKFCIVAEGKADIYPRFNPTWEWDTAAGDCILREAGGKVVDPKGKMLRYNKEFLKHESFVALGNTDITDIRNLLGL